MCTPLPRSSAPSRYRSLSPPRIHDKVGDSFTPHAGKYNTEKTNHTTNSRARQLDPIVPNHVKPSASLGHSNIQPKAASTDISNHSITSDSTPRPRQPVVQPTPLDYETRYKPARVQLPMVRLVPSAWALTLEWWCHTGMRRCAESVAAAGRRFLGRMR